MPYTKESTKYIYKRSTYVSGFWVHNCVICGDKFKCNRSTGKYCSQRCANDAAILRRKEHIESRRASAVHCLACGRPIEQSATYKIRKYCSASCKQRAYRSRNRSDDNVIPTTIIAAAL